MEINTLSSIDNEQCYHVGEIMRRVDNILEMPKHTLNTIHISYTTLSVMVESDENIKKECMWFHMTNQSENYLINIIWSSIIF